MRKKSGNKHGLSVVRKPVKAVVGQIVIVGAVTFYLFTDLTLTLCESSVESLIPIYRGDCWCRAE